MKKIPTIFVRDWNGDRSRITREPNPACQWVFDGEGVATRKYDGACCMVRDGKLYKRRELGPKQSAPADFFMVDHDEETGKTVGWVPVGDGPEDRWFREAFNDLAEGTYELLGPKVQGNVERLERNVLQALAPRSAITTSHAPSTACANGSMTAISRGSSSIIPTDACRRSSCGISG